jgi:trimeric autotransporter adhesin
MLNGPAPTGGLNVSIYSVPADIVAPMTVTVPEGQSSFTFSVSFGSVVQVTDVDVFASANGMTGRVSAGVIPPIPSSLTLAPTSVKGGSGVTATVVISAAAPPSGMPITVGSSNVAATVPTVTIPAGATSTTFTIVTSPVATVVTSQISAATYGGPRTAMLTIQPPHPTGVTFDQASVTGGSTAVATISIDGPAPVGGLTLTVSSDNTAASVPATVVVPEGASSVSFDVATSPVTEDTLVTVTVSDSSGSVQVTLSVTP